MSPARTVLFLCDYQAPYGGNFLPSLRALEAALNLRGTRVVWVFPAGARQRDWCVALSDGRRAVAFLPEGRLRALKTLDGIVRQEHVSLIHAHFGLFPLARAEALLHPRLKVLLHVHSDFSAGKRRSCFKRLAGTALSLLMRRRVTRVMVGAHMALSEKNAVCIPNGVDFSRDAACTLTREQLRAQFDIADNETLVLLFGWSPYIKGVDIAARAIERLKDKGFLLGLVTGREMTADKLKTWLTEHGCATAYLRFLPPSEDVFAYHRAADVMLSASRSETFSYALAEALYTGRPCVISDIPGTAWAAAYETVRVFPSGDDDDCAKMLAEAASGYAPEAYACTRGKVMADCSVDRWVNGVMRLYET